MNLLTISLILIIIILAVVVAVLTAVLIQTIAEAKKERTDLLNRLLSKNVSEYKQMTNVSEPAVKEKKPNTLNQQLENVGAIKHGGINPYPREL